MAVVVFRESMQFMLGESISNTVSIFVLYNSECLEM
jgi:hypothetical protein